MVMKTNPYYRLVRAEIRWYTESISRILKLLRRSYFFPSRAKKLLAVGLYSTAIILSFQRALGLSAPFLAKFSYASYFSRWVITEKKNTFISKSIIKNDMRSKNTPFAQSVKHKKLIFLFAVDIFLIKNIAHQFENFFPFSTETA